MQEKTTNLTASMQGTLYEANFKNRHPCGTLRKSFPSGNTFAEHSASHSRVETHLRNIPQVNSEWKHICGTFRKQV